MNTLILPDLADHAAIKAMNIVDIDHEFGKYRELAVHRIILLGLRWAFEAMPNLDRIYIDFSDTSTLRPSIRSNPDRKEYEANFGTGGDRQNPSRTIDRLFDKQFGQIRKQVGITADSFRAISRLFSELGCEHSIKSFSRANHLLATQYLLDNPNARWGPTLEAQLATAQMNADTAPARSRLSPSRM
jgi:hypothetical protein